MKRLQNGGGIHANGGQGIIQNNTIVDVGKKHFSDASTAIGDSTRSYGVDIYLDDMSAYWPIKNNKSKTIRLKNTGELYLPEEFESVECAKNHALKKERFDTEVPSPNHFCPGLSRPNWLNLPGGVNCTLVDQN